MTLTFQRFCRVNIISRFGIFVFSLLLLACNSARRPPTTEPPPPEIGQDYYDKLAAKLAADKVAAEAAKKREEESTRFMRELHESDAWVLRFGQPLKSCVTTHSERYALTSSEQAQIAAEASLGACDKEFRSMAATCPMSQPTCQGVMAKIKQGERARSITLIVEARAKRLPEPRPALQMPESKGHDI
jgi:hypothetical protein